MIDTGCNLLKNTAVVHVCTDVSVKMMETGRQTWKLESVATLIQESHVTVHMIKSACP